MGGRSCLPAKARSIGHHALAHAQGVAASSPLAALLALTQVPGLVQAGQGGKCHCNPILFRLSQSGMSAAELGPVLDMKASHGWLHVQVAVTCSSGVVTTAGCGGAEPARGYRVVPQVLIVISIPWRPATASSGLSGSMSLLWCRDNLL